MLCVRAPRAFPELVELVVDEPLPELRVVALLHGRHDLARVLNLVGLLHARHEVRLDGLPGRKRKGDLLRYFN